MKRLLLAALITTPLLSLSAAEVLFSCKDMNSSAEVQVVKENNDLDVLIDGSSALKSMDLKVANITENSDTLFVAENAQTRGALWFKSSMKQKIKIKKISTNGSFTSVQVDFNWVGDDENTTDTMQLIDCEKGEDLSDKSEDHDINSTEAL